MEKTELAEVVAHRVACRYRDGVPWADCGQEIEPLFPPPGSRSTVLITTQHADHPALRASNPCRWTSPAAKKRWPWRSGCWAGEPARAQRADAEHPFKLMGYLPLWETVLSTGLG